MNNLPREVKKSDVDDILVSISERDYSREYERKLDALTRRVKLDLLPKEVADYVASVRFVRRGIVVDD